MQEGRAVVDLSKEEKIQHMHKTMRRLHHPEFFIGLSDDMLNMSSFRPTTDIQERFNNTFDEDQRRHLRICLHPLFKRWAIFEKTNHKGQQLWHPVCMFHGERKEGYLPPDCQEHYLEHMRGKLGDFREVTYEDLRVVERCDMKKYGWESVHDFISEIDYREQKEAEYELDQQIDDFLDYNFWLAMRDAQAHYSQPWSTRAVELKSDPAKYRITQKNGYTIKERIYGEEGDLNQMKAAVEGKIESESASGKAAHAILERKNRKYKEKYGESLWERVTGGRVIWPEKDAQIQAEHSRQADELIEIAQGKELPERGVSLEEWLRECNAKRGEKEPVPVI